MAIKWNKVWHVVSLTCTIIVAIGAIVGIWAFLIKPSPKLTAVVEYSAIPWPPTIVDLAYQLDDLADVENIQKALADSNMACDHSKIAEEFSKYLKKGLKEYSGIGGLITHEGSYRIGITNVGKKLCTGVSVKLPNTCLVNVFREDNLPKSVSLGNLSVVTLGDLKPQERAFLMAWSTTSATEYQAKQIRVTHDLGIASIDLRKEVGWFGRWIDRHQFGVGFGIWLVLIVIYVVWLCGDLREKKFKEKREETTDAEKKEDAEGGK